MDTFIQGFAIGLSLTIMVGPITLTIIDASLTDGWKAGIVTGFAMWLSDLVFIGAIYYGGQELVEVIAVSNISAWVSFAAASILIAIGLTLWFLRNTKIDLSKTTPSPGHLIGHGIRGFLVNTFSPFTMIFWPTLIAGKVFGGELEDGDSKVFFISVMTAIILGDTLKALFANWIRQRISDTYMKYTRSAIAIMFVAGGIYMIFTGLSAL